MPKAPLVNLAMLPRLALVLVLVGFSAADVAAQSLSRADGSTEARPSPPSYRTPPLPAHSGDDTRKALGRTDARLKVLSSAGRQPVPSGMRSGGDQVTITHSASQEITALNAVACSNNDTGFTTDNQFWRVFDLSEAGIGADFTIESVEWGIEDATGTGLPETTINLYSLSGAFTRANLTLLGSRTYTVADADDLALVSVAFGDVTLSADEVLVVEWSVPDGVSAGYSVFPGTNAAGETGPTYVSSASCPGLAEPVTYASIEFPDVHWVLNVTGTVAGGVGDIVQDGSFESGTPNPFWEEGSTNVGTPLCDEGSCGLGGGTGPFDGNWWVWFGGVEANEEGFVEQDVVIPSGSATLSFHLEIPSAGQPGSMSVLMDGDELFVVTEADASSYSTYQEVTIDVSAYADGGTHALRFESSTQAATAVTNFFVDLIAIIPGGGGDPPPAAPAGLTATPSDGSVSLSWTAVAAPDLAGYQVYRATAPFTEASAATRLTTSPQAGTTYADGAVTDGTAYYYRVSAVDNGGNESPLSNQADATPMNPRPPTVTVSVNRAFGDAEDQQNYRLVALPGAVDVNLGSTLTGETPDDWRAFREAGFDGSMEFSHVECGGDGCRLLPGRGFWLLAENAWAVSDAYATVGLASDGTYSIPLQRGWNAISNPLEVDVPWQVVVDANGLGQAASLYRWNGTWQSASTFTSARSGEAFYVLNDDASRTMLRVPFPVPTAQPEPAPMASAWPEAAFELTLSVRVGGTASALAAVSMAPDAAFGLDDRDRFAPPGYFEAVGLAVANDSLHVGHRLRHDARPLRAEGHRYEVILTAGPGEMVEIAPEWVAGAGAYEAVLVNPASGERHALLHGEMVRLRVAASATHYDLLVGTSAFVDADAAVPQQMEAGSYPNPFVSATTIRYGLPEPGRVRLAVYNVLGERIALLLDDEARDAGYHTAVWHGANLASGVYFYVLETGARRLTGKMTVVK